MEHPVWETSKPLSESLLVSVLELGTWPPSFTPHFPIFAPPPLLLPGRKRDTELRYSSFLSRYCTVPPLRSAVVFAMRYALCVLGSGFRVHACMRVHAGEFPAVLITMLRR